MISRRNIRVKVMQTLYTLGSMEHGAQGNKGLADKILDEKLRQVLDLFTTAVLYTYRIAQYADIYARQRASRYLVTAEDRKLDTRLSTSSYATMLQQNNSFNARISDAKLERYIDEDRVKKIFSALLKTNEYMSYTELPEHTAAQDREMMRYIWEQLMMADEDTLSAFADELPGWEDDSELIIMLMQNFYKGAGKVDFSKLLSTEKREYAHDLLHAVIDKDMLCTELIEPKLTNWDKERVAIIDMLLLRMGICEFLFFPTIPTKVTINEYIDIAKQYSTPQSGQFVNGVLDNILKDLVKEDKVTKTDRKRN